MLYLILFVTTIFLFSAFLGSLPISIPNTFIAYVFLQVHFLLHFFLPFCVASLCIFFIFIRKQLFHKDHSVDSHYLRCFFQTIAVWIIGAFAAYVLLFCIAWIQITSFAILTNINPAFLGITTNPTTIYKELQKNNYPPDIIASGTSGQNEAAAIAQAISGTTNFYGSAVLSGVPDVMILPIRKLSSSLLFIDNTLIVTSINQNDMQPLSPLIGYLFVQKYFPNRHIISFPKTSVMNQDQFIAYQKNGAKKKLTTVRIDIQKMEDGVSSLSATIQKDNEAIAENQLSQSDALKKQSTQYDTCVSSGTYVSGTFRPSYTKADCQKMLDLWTSTLDALGQEGNSLSDTLKKDQQQLKDYQYYDAFFKAQQALMTVTNNNIPDELGVFQPPNGIQIVVATNNAHAIADYFETLCHEYLHYASYTTGKRLDSSFFEEGLTEYFARQTIQDNMQIDTNIAYPAQVKILTEMMKRIAEPDFADIYFAKDEIGLEKTLDLVYGDTFYADNITLFDTLQYTSDPQQQLQLANTIMQKIGGQPLTEKDLFSTQSSL